MDKKEALEFLRQALAEIPRLEELPYDNKDYKLWFDGVEKVVRNVLGNEDIKTLFHTDLLIPVIDHLTPVEVRQSFYVQRLREYGTNIEKIINKYKLLGIEAESSTTIGLPPKAFIAHGGKSEALDKLCRFLTALGVMPIIVEEQSSENRSVGENVDHYARQCDFAIILATKGDIDSKTKRFIPRGNVLIEIGKAQELFKNRIIYLLQSGAQLPTDISEKVRARFTSQRMDDAFTAIARELTAFGILKAIKPPKE